MGGIVVTKSLPVLVLPASEPKTIHVGGIDVKLSPYDMPLVRAAQTAVLLFPHPIPSPAETIKAALSQALVHYHAISGRLHASDAVIRCTGEGVSFISASADCAMKDAKFSVGSLVSTVLLDDLAAYYPDDGCLLDTDPMLMVQVTEFSCDGFVVGATWSHAVADCAGMGQFLQAVGELSRGMPHPSVVPVRRFDGALAAAVFPSSGAVAQCLRGLRPISMAQLDIHVPSCVISLIKDAFFRSQHLATTCTVFEAVSAMLWQCRTRAVMSDPHAPTALLFPANVRRHAGARTGYYGNCLAMQVVVAKSGTVATGDVVEIVELIQRAKERIPEQFKPGGDGSSLGFQSPLDMFIVTCWRNLGLEKVDFGGGRPARVMSHKKNKVGMPTCFITGDGRGGSYVLSGCVTDQHAGSFLTELGKSTST